MLDTALKFLKDELGDYFFKRTGSHSVVVKMSSVVDETGKYSFDKETVCASIINIAEERTFKSNSPEYTYVNGQHVVLEPALKLNLYVMFAANFTQYDVALRYISYVLTYFQSHPCFTPDQNPALENGISKIVVELQSLNYEQLNQIWTFVGGKQLPSVIYKVSMIALQDESLKAVQPPLTVINTDMASK